MSRHTIPAWMRFGLGLILGSAVALNAWAGDSAINVLGGYTAVTGPAGATLIFPIQRSGDLSHDAYISYKTQDGSAVAGHDYTATHGYFKIPAGASNADLNVPVAGSSVNYPDKTFTLDVLGASALPPALGFAPAQSFATGGQGPDPGEMVAADMNGDGLPDLIAVNYANSTVSVALNTTAQNAATAGFTAPQSFSTGPSPTTVTAADLNGDGKPDLIITDSADGTVSVLINIANPGDLAPSFAPEVSIATGAQPSSVTVADINGDGKPDVIVGHDGEAFVSVLLNATPSDGTTPAFSAQDHFMVGPDIEAVAAADLNGDGKPDLVASVAGSGLAVLMNQTATGAPAASFADPQLVGGTASRSIVAADVNGDGVADLIDLNPSGSVEVQLNTTATGAATASFSALQAFAASGSPSALAVADVDGDGMADLLVGDATNGVVTLLVNGTAPWGSSANFSVAHTFAIAGVGSLTTTDLNGDTQPDILGAQQANGGTATVLMNTTMLTDQAQFAPIQAVGGTPSQSIVAADLNGDGEADLIGLNSVNNTVEVQMNTTPAGATTASFAAVQAFAVGNNPTNLAVVDMNGDGMPDLVAGNLADSTVSVLVNQTASGGGPAVFLAQQVFFVEGADSLAIADVNGDGLPDIIGAQQGGYRYGSVLLNQTVSASTSLAFDMPQQFDTGGQGPGAGGLVSADVNRDYIPDVITTDYYGNTVAISLNETAVGGSNVSYAVPQTFVTGPNPGQVLAADLNGDFSLDLIVANGDGTVSVLMNTTVPADFTANFAPQVAFATGGSGPSSITVADVNGDGKPDLVVANSAATSLSVLLNETPAGAATPAFSAPQPFTVGAGAQSVTAGDLDGDGKPDLVVSLGGSGLGVLINTHDTISGTPASATGTIHYEIATPVALIQPSNKDFGDVGLGQSSGLYPMDLFNDGTADLTGIAVSVTGADAGDFTVTNDCPTSLAPNGHCTIYVAFSPGALGSRTANLSVASNDASSPDTAALTGTGVGPAATANPGSVATTADQAVSGTFSATLGYTGQTLTFHTVPNPGHGTVTVTNLSTGAFTYTPNAGYAGTDSFYFYAVDAYGSSSNTALETVTINDLAATANGGSVTTGPDAAVNGTLSATTAYNGQTLTYSVVTSPVHGTVSVTAGTGAFTYTPASGYTGADSFTFKVTDGAGTASNVASEGVTVTDTAATANPSTLGTTAGQAANGTLAATAAYAGQTLSFSVVSQPSNGTVSITDAGTGAYTYTPGSAFAGADSFTFRVTDAAGTASNVATVSVTVGDRAPTASGGSVSTAPDTAAGGTLQAGTSYAGQTLTFAVNQPAHGSVSVNAATGAFTYTPNQGFAGSDPFTFTAKDAYGTSSSPATETVTVSDQAPSAANGSVSTTSDVAVSGSLQGTPRYAGQSLTFSVTADGAHGTASITDAATGAFHYTPSQAYAGTDTFTFQVIDQWGSVSMANETVTVNDVAPTIGGATSVSMFHNKVYDGYFTATPAYAGQVLTISVGANPTHGTLSLNATNQTYTYTPVHNYRGSDSFSIKVTDQWGASNTLAVNVTVK